MHRLAFLLVSVALFDGSARVLSQTWMRTYGGASYDRGYSVQQTADSGYVVTGLTESFGVGSADAWLIKTDQYGETLWTRTYGGAGYDWGFSVQQTVDSGYIIVGFTSSFGAGGYDVWLIKTDHLGDTLWTRTYGGMYDDEGYSVQQTADSGYIVTGSTGWEFGVSSADLWLIRTDQYGDTLWTRTYGGTEDDWGSSVQETPDLGYIITGGTRSFGAGSADVWLLKTDQSGDTLWAKTHGGTSRDGGSCVRQTSDSGYVVTGETNSFGAFWDVLLLKTDQSGNSLWTRSYGGMGYNEDGRSVQQTSDSGYIIAGRTDTFGAGSTDVWLIKTDQFGNAIWTRTYGGIRNDEGYSIQQTSDSGYIIAGWTASFGAGLSDVWLIKTDAEGNVGVEESKKSKATTGQLALKLFPNPTLTTVQVRSLHSLSPSATLTLYDTSGRKVKEFDPPAGGTTLLDVSSLRPGVYFARLKAQQYEAVKKLVVLANR